MNLNQYDLAGVSQSSKLSLRMSDLYKRCCIKAKFINIDHVLGIPFMHSLAILAKKLVMVKGVGSAQRTQGNKK